MAFAASAGNEMRSLVYAVIAIICGPHPGISPMNDARITAAKSFQKITLKTRK